MTCPQDAYVAVVAGNPRAASRTTMVGLSAAERLRDACAPGGRIEVVELAALAGELFAPDSPARAEAHSLVTQAAGVVVVSPIYKATYTGLLKAFLDHFAAGALGGRPAVAAMLGGSQAHRLAVEVHLRPLLAELGASTLTGLYVTESELPRLEEVVDAWWDSAGALLAATAPLEVTR